MSVGKSVVTLVKLDQTSPANTVVVLIDGGASGKFSIYAHRTSGAGTANMTIDGAYKATPGANDKVSVKTSTAVGVDAMTQLATAKDAEFSYLVIGWTPTGTLTEEVYIISY